MPTQIPYDRSKAAAYAEKWAFSRNPRYISFDGMGGDCTSFVSQCLYAGTGVMNYTRDTGWYYNSASDRAAAWSGVPYLYRFELMGTPDDINTVRKGVSEFWQRQPQNV